MPTSENHIPQSTKDKIEACEYGHYYSNVYTYKNCDSLNIIVDLSLILLTQPTERYSTMLARGIVVVGHLAVIRCNYLSMNIHTVRLYVSHWTDLHETSWTSLIITTMSSWNCQNRLLGTCRLQKPGATQPCQPWIELY